MEGINLPLASHSPPIHAIHDITAVEKSYAKIQQCQLGGRISYKTIAIEVVYLYSGSDMATL